MSNKARLKGAGGGHGTGGFIAQRATAVALLFLGPWFIVSLAIAAKQGAIATFFASPLNGGLTAAFLIAGAWHMQIGMREIIEDYIGKPGTRGALESLNILIAVFAALAGLYGLAKISFGV
jgi:succinate dehydrogenase / fumarate reductase membrane anchor subunit